MSKIANERFAFKLLADANQISDCIHSADGQNSIVYARGEHLSFSRRRQAVVNDGDGLRHCFPDVAHIAEYLDAQLDAGHVALVQRVLITREVEYIAQRAAQ